MHHPYWGEIQTNFNDLPESTNRFLIPGFGEDATGQQINISFHNREQPIDLTPQLLDEYAEAFERFLQLLPALLPEIKARAFAYYQEYYAQVYEDQAQSGEPPLGLINPGLHFARMRLLDDVSVQSHRAVTLQFDYEIDTEHDLEILIVDGTLHDIGGALDTYVRH
jgi:hypothetical protein